MKKKGRNLKQQLLASLQVFCKEENVCALVLVCVCVCVSKWLWILISSFSVLSERVIAVVVVIVVYFYLFLCTQRRYEYIWFIQTYAQIHVVAVMLLVVRYRLL